MSTMQVSPIGDGCDEMAFDDLETLMDQIQVLADRLRHLRAVRDWRQTRLRREAELPLAPVVPLRRDSSDSRPVNE